MRISDWSSDVCSSDLVPRREALREIYELSLSDQQLLLRESSTLGLALMDMFVGDKLNIGALGNMVPQLHLHHIVRHVGDPAWPAPVWGRQAPQPYAQAIREQRLAMLRERLADGLTLRARKGIGEGKGVAGHV